MTCMLAGEKMSSSSCENGHWHLTATFSAQAALRLQFLGFYATSPSAIAALAKCRRTTHGSWTAILPNKVLWAAQGTRGKGFGLKYTRNYGFVVHNMRVLTCFNNKLTSTLLQKSIYPLAFSNCCKLHCNVPFTFWADWKYCFRYFRQ